MVDGEDDGGDDAKESDVGSVEMSEGPVVFYV